MRIYKEGGGGQGGGGGGGRHVDDYIYTYIWRERGGEGRPAYF